MDFAGIALKALWAGVFSGGLAVLLTSPRSFIFATFLCGFGGVVVRDGLIVLGLNGNWATAVAATAIVAVAGRILRGRDASPVVLICGVLPLGSSVALLRMIFDLIKLSYSEPAVRQAISVDFVTNLASTFAVSLCIAFGIGVGAALAGIVRWDQPAEN